MPESKVVAEPESPNGMIQVKERSKVYTGQLIAVGSKAEIQQKLNTILAESQEQPGQLTTATEPPQTTEPPHPAESSTYLYLLTVQYIIDFIMIFIHWT